MVIPSPRRALMLALAAILLAVTLAEGQTTTSKATLGLGRGSATKTTSTTSTKPASSSPLPPVAAPTRLVPQADIVSSKKAVLPKRRRMDYSSEYTIEQVMAKREEEFAAKNMSMNKRGGVEDLFELGSALFDLAKMAITACVIAQCREYVIKHAPTVTTTSYVDPPATIYVNSIQYQTETTTSFATGYAFATAIVPSTQIISFIAIQTSTATATTYVRRDHIPTAAPTPAPTPFASHQVTNEEVAEYFAKKALDPRAIYEDDDPGCLKAQKVIEIGDVETQLQNAANKLAGVEEEEEHECNKYWQVTPATLIYFMARNPHNITVSRNLLRTETSTLQTTTTSTSTLTQTSLTKTTTRVTQQATATATQRENLRQNWNYCTANANPSILTSLCQQRIGTALPSYTQTVLSQPPPTATTVISGAVLTRIRQTAALATSSITRTTTSTVVTGTNVEEVSTAVATSTERISLTSTFTEFITSVTTSSVFPIYSTTTQINNYFRKRLDTSCAADPVTWFNRAFASNPDSLSALCRAYVAPPDDATVTSVLPAELATSYQAGSIVESTRTTGTNTIRETETVTAYTSIQTDTTSFLPFTTTKTERFEDFDVSTSITETTTTRVFPTQTEVAVSRQTCPATRDGKTPFQHGTDASGNSQCGVQNAGGANRMNCVYSKSPAIRGGLVYDSACGQCQPQMIGADPYSGYNDNTAKQYRSGARGLFFVCPATDARTGSDLNMQYVDPNTGPNGGINCNYVNPSGYVETCVYDRNSGILLGDNKATWPDRFCYQRAAQASCPNPKAGYFRDSYILGSTVLQCNYSDTTCYYDLSEGLKSQLVEVTTTCGQRLVPDGNKCQLSMQYVDGSG